MLYYVAKCPLKCIYITKLFKETVLMDKKAAVARIEEIMREKGITREQFEQNAEVADTVKQWKKNAKRDANGLPSLYSIIKACEYLEVTLGYFFTLEKSEARKMRNDELYDAICALDEESLKLAEAVVKRFRQGCGQ